jgi:HSP20 family protein
MSGCSALDNHTRSSPTNWARTPNLSERRYGSFQRSFGVPDGVNADKIEANFKNGLLTVTQPKTAQAQKSEKKIAIKKA